MTATKPSLKQRLQSVVTPTTIVPKAETRALGRIGANRWIAARGQEFLVGSRLDAETDPRSRGGYFLAEPDTVTDETDGREHTVGTIYHRLDAYEPGTYAALLEKGRSQRRTLARTPRPVDGLRGLDLLAHRAGIILDLPRGFHPRQGEHDTAAYVPSKGPVRGATAIVEAIESKGVRLSVVNGQLVAIAPGGRIPSHVAPVLDRAGRMLVAHLNGDGGARCELKHSGKTPPPEAWTCLEPSGLLACEAHASGELELSDQ